ncbi:hypothetical protein B0H66DRAFT_603082 [Apodospora peruviana]|uniref:Uncharacterized protein n=1 Tax=Apodospora peruviana TaxID=516989 RepID=A0AAE0M4K3_9PEZI|nr:hypothetical protein B0H66DRAFT_603082 [Apodospora peruviana]
MPPAARQKQRAADTAVPLPDSLLQLLQRPRDGGLNVAEGASPVVVARQQKTSTIPASYGALDSGPDPGTVAGIVLGSVAGFILILYLLYMCINIGNGIPTDDVSSVVTRKSRRTTHKSSHHHHHSGGPRPRSATVEIRTTSRGGPVIIEDIRGPPEMDEIIVEETTRRRRSTSRGPPVRVVGGSDNGSDEVVVIEERGPPRRHRSTSVRRSVERRSSGYREVDPDRFAGGEAPMREIRRSTSRRRYD